jgi:catechol 2,3-dioxygenase-like lactoylglutathione lyase family enzyme
MNLNHLNLPLADPVAAGAFFVEHLGFRLIGQDAHGEVLVVDGGGMALVLSPQSSPGVAYPEGFHVGFRVSEEAHVLRMLDLVTSLRRPIVQPLAKRGGLLNFRFEAPGPVPVECYWRLPA